MTLETLIAQIQACRVCEKHLPFPPNPVLRARASATLRIVGQAAGMRVHRTKLPWNDPSGDRLRSWLQMDRHTFYDDRKIAITSMGFCYPGQGKQGDLPPRPECAKLWHKPLTNALSNVQLTLLIGRYAQHFYLGSNAKNSLTETVKNGNEYLPEFLPLPHPSPRNYVWFKNNPWFEETLLPILRDRLQHIFS
jgi:uracil-DNA glycosylase